MYCVVPVCTSLCWYVHIKIWVQKWCKPGSNPRSPAWFSLASPLHCESTYTRHPISNERKVYVYIPACWCHLPADVGRTLRSICKLHTFHIYLHILQWICIWKNQLHISLIVVHILHILFHIFQWYYILYSFSAYCFVHWTILRILFCMLRKLFWITSDPLTYFA